MSTAVMTNRLELASFADTALKAVTRLWFVAAVVGQLVFAFAVALSVVLRRFGVIFTDGAGYNSRLRTWRSCRQFRRRHAGNLGRHRHARRSDAADSASPVAISRLSSLERAYLHVDCLRTRHGRSLHDLDPGKHWRPFRNT